MATNTMFMWTQATSKAYKGLPQSRQYNFKNADVAALKENFPDLVNKIDQKWSEVNDRMENNIRSLSPENKKLFLLIKNE